MAVHLQDEQEIDNFKYFWHRYGRWLFALLVIVALGYLGWVLYQSNLRDKNAKAADVFETFVSQGEAGNEAGSKKALIELQSHYGKSLAATQATLMMAGSAFDHGKYDEAVKHLKWVADRQSNAYIQTITAQRLATVYLQQRKYDLALKALDIQVDNAFKPILLDTKGDVLQAQQKNKEAVVAYQAALKLLPKEAPQRELLQMKIDALS